MRVDVYASLNDPDLMVVVSEGADPKTLALPDQVTVNPCEAVCRGVDLSVGADLTPAGVRYAVIDIIATGFHVAGIHQVSGVLYA